MKKHASNGDQKGLAFQFGSAVGLGLRLSLAKFVRNVNVSFILYETGVYLVTHQTEGGGAFRAHGVTH